MVTRAFSPFEGLHRGLLTTARGTPVFGWSQGLVVRVAHSEDCWPLAAHLAGTPGVHSIAYTVLGHTRGAMTSVRFNHKRGL